MRHKGLFISAIFIVLLLLSFCFGMIAYLLSSSETNSAGIFGKDGVGLIKIEGTIIDSMKTLRELEEFRKSKKIKAIVVRIDSPGGAVAPSQEMFEAIKYVKNEKPVIVSMGSVAASGGYYVACGASKIYANAGTTTGSIGVRLEHLMIGDLMKWVGIGHENMKSGKFKDLLPIDKPISPEAREILQVFLDDIHEQFKNDVATSRSIDRSKIDEIADGRIFTGEQAKTLGLVDEIGGYTQAVLGAAEVSGIKGYPEIIYPKKEYKFIEKLMAETKALILGASANSASIKAVASQ